MNGKKATRPCRCGHLDDAAQACSKAPRCAEEYQSRISGPLFDRIDLHVEVGAVNPMDLTLPPPAESSAAIAARIARAREVQKRRYASLDNDPPGTPAPENIDPAAIVAPGLRFGRHAPPVRTNAEADGTLLEKVAAPDEAGRKLLADAVERLKLSARGYHRMLRVARTLADLEVSGGVRRSHVAEALSFRRIAPNRGF